MRLECLDYLHPTNVTALLLQWGKGDEAARERLIPLVHRELHQIARRCMAGERVGNSLQATALVNEAYVRLVDGTLVEWHDRAHFLAVAARIMRRILVDHARARGARKRGGGDARVTFDEALVVTAEARENFVALDDALEALAKFDERKSRVVDLRRTMVPARSTPAGGWRVDRFSRSAPRLGSLHRSRFASSPRSGRVPATDLAFD